MTEVFDKEELELFMTGGMVGRYFGLTKEEKINPKKFLLHGNVHIWIIWGEVC